MEIQDKLNDTEAIIGVDGKILFSDTEKNSSLKNNYSCGICSHKFSTKSSLAYHIRWKHNKSKLIYSCTECKETFPFAWCVFRHLIKVHRKSTTQVRKVRNVVHNNAVKRCDVMERKTNIVKKNGSGLELSENVYTEDQQWMSNFEDDNDLQRCGGCGRKFERKAALNSHAQMCMKRIAVCKSLKENTGKKAVSEEKSEQVLKTSKTDSDLVHVRRRKPLVVHKIYKYDLSSLEEIIGPLPRHNNEQINTTDNISSSDSEMNIKNKPEDISASVKSDMFYVGNVMVSKVFGDNNNHEETSASDIGNGLQIQEKVEDNINLEHEQEENFNKKSKEEDELNKEEKLEDNIYKENNHEDTLNKDENQADNLIQENQLEDNLIQENQLEDNLIEENQLEDNLNKENKIDGSDTTEINDTNIINTVESLTFNGFEQKIQTDGLFASNQVSNENVNSNSSFELVSIDTNDISPMDIQCESSSNLTNMNKSKMSLAKQSSNYINVEKQTCLPCQKPFNTHKELMNHMAYHFNWYRYHCNICQYLSYTKSKCKHHVISKHSIRDKIRLRNLVSRIPRSKVREGSTSFTKHYKTKTVDSVKTNVNVTIDQPECDDILDETPVDPFNGTPTNDISIREMVLEVILGSSQSILEEIPIANMATTDGNLDSSISDVLIIDEQVPQNSTVTNEVITPESPKVIRPVRRRIMPVKKDFLYDMKPILKFKRSRDQKLRRKTKLCSKSIKLSKRRVKSVSYNSPIDILTTSSNCLQHETLNSDVNTGYHVTGDV